MRCGLRGGASRIASAADSARLTDLSSLGPGGKARAAEPAARLVRLAGSGRAQAVRGRAIKLGSWLVQGGLGWLVQVGLGPQSSGGEAHGKTRAARLGRWLVGMWMGLGLQGLGWLGLRSSWTARLAA